MHEAILCTILCKIYCILFRPPNLNFAVNNVNENNSKILSNDNIGCDGIHDNQNQNHVIEKMNKKIE